MAELSEKMLLRLMTWLSPVFPVGAFSYSHGLERAVHDGLVHDRGTLVSWLGDLVTCGSGWNDAELFAEAWREEDGERVEELAQALAGTREREMETMLQGEAFLQAAAAWSEDGGPATSAAYPVAVGATATGHGIPLDAALTAYLHAFVSNLIQAAVRLVPLGQRDGVAAMAALEPVLLEAGARASHATLDDLGSATFMSEIMSLKHETQYSRLFRS